MGEWSNSIGRNVNPGRGYTEYKIIHRTVMTAVAVTERTKMFARLTRLIRGDGQGLPARPQNCTRALARPKILRFPFGSGVPTGRDGRK